MNLPAAFSRPTYSDRQFAARVLKYRIKQAVCLTRRVRVIGMTEDAEELSELIGDIYDASLDQNLWPTVLQRFCEFVGGKTSGVMSHDILQRNANFFYTWNDNPAWTKLYAEKYARINPAVVPSMLQTPVGEVSTILDFVPVEEFRASTIYKEFCVPQGYLDSIQAVLEKSATSYAAATIIFAEEHGAASEQARRRMKLLAPHFRRAVQIGKVIDLKEVKAAALADALDGIAAGMWLLDANARIVHANAAGQTMLAENAAVHAASGKLMLLDLAGDRALQEMLGNLAAGDAAIGDKGISMPLRGRDGKDYVAQILPLTSGARQKAGVAHSAAAALFIRAATLSLPHPLETIAGLYRLTPAELRVLMMIIDIGGVPEVAPVLGVSQRTVKTHLKHVFEKTGVRRQADLVKLAARFMSPTG